MSAVEFSLLYFKDCNIYHAPCGIKASSIADEYLPVLGAQERESADGRNLIFAVRHSSQEFCPQDGWQTPPARHPQAHTPWAHTPPD